jgi:hypothetical protein
MRLPFSARWLRIDLINRSMLFTDAFAMLIAKAICSASQISPEFFMRVLNPAGHWTGVRCRILLILFFKVFWFSAA